MSSFRPVKWLLALVVLLLGGLLRLPLEKAFSAELETKNLAEARLNLSLRDELGQSTFIAVLGGFRSLVATILEIQSIEPWQRHDWAKVDAAYALCTRLQPRNWHYWEWRAWMSSHNAFDYYKYQDLTRPGLQPWLRQNLIDRALAVLDESMLHLPNNYRPRYNKAALLCDFEKNKHADYYQASLWYRKAWELRPDRRYIYRFSVYNLARAPGHELEAWPLLLEMYNSGEHPESDRTPSGMTLLVQLYPKVKARLPGAELPEELLPQVPRILAEEQKRREAIQRRLDREARDAKALEDALLKQPRK
jgi:hypothetical protein